MSLKRWLKEIVRFVAIAALLSAIFGYVYRPEHPVERLTHESLKLIDGSRVKLFDGKPTLLYFWMTRCPVCKLQAPVIEAAAARYRVISIAAYASPEEATRALREKGVRFATYADSTGEMTRRFGIKAFPTLLLYDADGTLRFTLTGYTTQAGIAARMAIPE